MTTILFGFSIAVLLILIVSILLWSKVHFAWLTKLCNLLILSLPFEYFPRLEIGGVSWRLSQILVIIGFWIITLLILKKDERLLFHKLHFASFYPLIFLALSAPSWFAAQDLQRFIIHMVGTIFVFGAFVLLANFATDIWKNLRRLTFVLFGCSIFGLYQFFGDLAGIPPAFTLLREHYTKIVFGVPRVQGTAVEPLYFAGMLLIAIFVLVFWICERVESKNKVLKKYCHLEPSQKSCVSIDNISTTFNSELIPVSFAAHLFARDNFTAYILNQFQFHNLIYLFLTLLTIFVVFLLTISKGTFAVLAILTLALMPVLYFTFDFIKRFVNQYIVQSLLVGILGLALFFSFVNPIALLGEVGANFVDTLSGTSASAVERNMFINEAIVGIKQNPFFGIGIGQFGDFAGKNLGSINEDGKAIVNNVYLEIWLEQGILAIYFFVFVLFQPIFVLLKKVATWTSPLHVNIQAKLTGLSLIFILVGYYIQWTLFSPIFIMPIFIMLGLAYNLISSQD